MHEDHRLKQEDALTEPWWEEISNNRFLIMVCVAFLKHARLQGIYARLDTTIRIAKYIYPRNTCMYNYV